MASYPFGSGGTSTTGRISAVPQRGGNTPGNLDGLISRSNGARQIDTPLRKILESDMSLEPKTAVEAVYHSDRGRIVATLIGIFGDFDLAEEFAQVRAKSKIRDARIPYIVPEAN